MARPLASRRIFRAALRITTLVALGLAGRPANAEGFDFLNRLLDRDVDVVIDTDVTVAGRKLTPATPAHPIRYQLIVLGYKDYGNEPGDSPAPDRNGMLATLQKMLSDRGYLPADKKHAPELVLALAWGTMNTRRSYAVPFMGGEKLRLQQDLDPVVAQMTPYSLRRQFWTPLQEYVVDVSGGDLYVISVWAFEVAAAQHGQMKLLWQTKLACPSTGLEIGLTLQRMARAALPYLGHDTPLPVRVTAPRLKYEVDMGELQTIEFLDAKSPDKSNPPAKPNPSGKAGDLLKPIKH